MVLLTGVFVWVAALVLLLRLAALGAAISPVSGRRTALWCVLICGAAALLFRPHELILGGQDPGVYVNTAASFARHGAVFFKDPLLARIPVQTRSVFMFGHRGYGLTKDSCLAIRDMATAEVGPRFPPLFSLTMSIPARLGNVRWMLYVVPFFALCAAVALSVLARQLIAHSWAGVLTFVCYVTTPLLVWHARAPRPEVIAGFFFFGGCALVIHAWRAARWRNWFDLAGGALCIAMAPFFHVTAWFLAVASAVPVGLVILSGRYDFLLYVPVAIGGLAGYVFQTLRITDHYNLRRFIEPVAKHWEPAAAALAALLILLTACSLYTGRRRPGGQPSNLAWLQRRAAATRPLGIAFAALTVCVFVILFLRATPISARRLIEPEYHYAYPTDMRVVVEFLSLPVLLVALAGVARMMLSRSPGSAERLAVVFCLLPACWLIGNMYDIFMTRYMLTAIVPLAALGLASALTSPAQRGFGRIAPAAGAISLVVWQTASGWHLAATTEYRGLTEFLGRFANRISESRGPLLCEYSRLGAPFEHMFGIPTLALDNETQYDYSKALTSWDAVVREHSQDHAFFLTPFQAPVSELFEFKPVRAETIEYPRLRPELFRLPRKGDVGTLSLCLYEMIPNREHEVELPYIRKFDAGNTGLRNFSRGRGQRWEVAGVRVGPGCPAEVRLDPRAGSDGDWNLLLFFLNTTSATPAAPRLVINDGTEEVPVLNWDCLVGDWWLMRAAGSTGGSIKALGVVASSDLLLTDVALNSAQGLISLKPSDTTGQVTAAETAPFVGRWSRARCGFLAPVPSTGGAYLLVFAQAPKASTAPVSLTISLGNATVMSSILRAGAWTWQAAELKPPTAPSGMARFDASIRPPWNPGEDGYPNDLGVRFGYVAVVAGVSNNVSLGR